MIELLIKLKTEKAKCSLGEKTCNSTNFKYIQTSRFQGWHCSSPPVSARETNQAYSNALLAGKSARYCGSDVGATINKTKQKNLNGRSLFTETFFSLVFFIIALLRGINIFCLNTRLADIWIHKAWILTYWIASALESVWCSALTPPHPPKLILIARSQLCKVERREITRQPRYTKKLSASEQRYIWMHLSGIVCMCACVDEERVMRRQGIKEQVTVLAWAEC